MADIDSLSGLIFYRNFRKATQKVLHFVLLCGRILSRRDRMQFEWDDEKEKINIIKHGIDFSTAALVFGDENRLEYYDELHSDDEDRYITIGLIGGEAFLVMVVYTERGEAIRLISARKATKQERRRYYYDDSQRY
jgi:hypothetical protein